MMFRSVWKWTLSVVGSLAATYLAYCYGIDKGYEDGRVVGQDAGFKHATTYFRDSIQDHLVPQLVDQACGDSILAAAARARLEGVDSGGRAGFQRGLQEGRSQGLQEGLAGGDYVRQFFELLQNQVLRSAAGIDSASDGEVLERGHLILDTSDRGTKVLGDIASEVLDGELIRDLRKAMQRGDLKGARDLVRRLRDSMPGRAQQLKRLELLLGKR